MKIVQIIDTLQIGGAERVLVTLANLLKKNAHEVTVITLLKPGMLATQLAADIPVRALQRGWKWNIFKMYQLVRWCRPFDVVHVHSSHNLRYVFLAFRLFGWRKTIFFHEHYGDIEINQAVHWHQRLIYPQTVLIGVSQKICDWAVQQVKMPAERVHLLINSVPKYVSSNKAIREVDALRLLTVANIRPTKHLEFVLDVLQHLLQKRPATLTIVGQVNDRDYYDYLLKKIRENNLQAHVYFIHDCADVQPILHQYDLALHPAKSESGPLVIIEYLAQCLPFITYETGEVVAKIKSALPMCIVAHFDVIKWIAAIEALLLQPQDDLQKKVVSVYDTCFSEAAYYQQCLNIYRASLVS